RPAVPSVPVLQWPQPWQSARTCQLTQGAITLQGARRGREHREAPGTGLAPRATTPMSSQRRCLAALACSFAANAVAPIDATAARAAKVDLTPSRGSRSGERFPEAS